MERKASGLIKTYSGLDILIFNVLFASAFVVPIFIYQTVGYSFPATDTVFATFLGIIPAVIFGILYIFWTAVFPRSGGDYAINSRVLGPTAGFVISFITLNAALAFSAGWWGNLFTTFVTSDVLGLLAGVFGQSSLLESAFTLTQPGYALITGAIVILVAAILVSVVRPDTLNKVWLILAGLGLLSMLLTGILLFLTTPSSFSHAFNVFAQRLGVNDTNYYQTVVNSQNATAPRSLNTSAPGFWTGGFVYGGWILMWFVWGSSFVAGEIRQVKRSQTVGIISSVLVTAALSLFIMFPYYNAQGTQFTANSIALYYGGQWQLYPVIPMQFTTPMIMATTMPIWWTVLSLIIVIGMYAWTITTIALLMVGASRTLLAWSFDRLIPAKFGTVNPKYHQPHWAMLLITLLTIGYCAVYSFQASVFTALWSSFMQLVPIWFSVALSAALLPFVKKSWYETAGISKYRVGALPLITVFGLAIMAFCAFGAFEFLTDPGWAWAGAGMNALSLYATVILSGIVIYLVARAWRARQKISLAAAYKELPVE